MAYDKGPDGVSAGFFRVISTGAFVARGFDSVRC
jgi:hypothetical protein